MEKSYKSIFLFALSIIICLSVTGISGATISQGEDETDRIEIINTINSYFSLRYEAYITDQPFNFSAFIDKKDPETMSWLEAEEEKREVEIFIKNIYGTRIAKHSFHIDFPLIEVEKNRATVKALENNEVTYEDNPKYPSALANLEHQFILKRSEDKWIIVIDEYSDDLTRLLEGISKAKAINNIQHNHDLNMKAISEFPPDSFTKQNAAFIETQFYPYGNILAATYADNNFDGTGPVPLYVRNQAGWGPTWPIVYKRYQGQDVSDCTNFLSQAVFEGVFYTASDPDYFYPDSINHYLDWWYYKFSPVIDGSFSWITVEGFYEFLTENYFNLVYGGIAVRGPAGQSLSDTCNIQIGDLIFMYSDVEQQWHHSVIVDQLGQNPCLYDNVYVAAHDTNRRFYKLSNYTGYILYPVKIMGYIKEFLSYLPVITLSSPERTSEYKISNPYPSPENNATPFEFNLNPYPIP